LAISQRSLLNKRGSIFFQGFSMEWVADFRWIEGSRLSGDFSTRGPMAGELRGTFLLNYQKALLPQKKKRLFNWPESQAAFGLTPPRLNMPVPG
jgi:hypothetical protein